MQLKTASKATENAAEGVEYVPDFRGNRDEPPESQGYVMIKPMTARELRKVEAAIKIKTSGRDDALSAFERKSWAVKEHVLKERITEVHNIHAEPGRPISGGDELVSYCLDNDAALIGLLDDIYSAILDLSKLEEGLRKN